MTEQAVATKLEPKALPPTYGVELEAINWSDRSLIQSLPIGLIFPDERNPRGEITDIDVADILESVPTDGIRDPIVIRLGSDGKAYILSGHRRFKAAEIAGYERVTCIIYKDEIDDAEALRLLIVYNMQRKEVLPVHTAKAYDQLRIAKNCSPAELANLLSIPATEVKNYLSLLNLSEELRTNVNEGLFTLGEAFRLAKLSPEAADKEAADILMKGPAEVTPPTKKYKPRQSGKSPLVGASMPLAPGIARNNGASAEPSRFVDQQTGISITISNTAGQSVAVQQQALHRIADEMR